MASQTASVNLNRFCLKNGGFCYWVLFGFVLLLLNGCAATSTRESVSVQVEVIDSLNLYKKEYLLQPGDVVEVFVYRHKDFSRTTMIRPDGKITLPLIDDVQAAGMTTAELDAELTQMYSKRIIDPEVTVIVENAQEPMIYVFGEVGRPAAIPFRQARTVAQALAKVGGASKSGVLNSVSIIRLNEDGFFEAHTVEGYGYNQPEMYMALHNMLLAPDDLVVIPEGYRSQIMRLIQDFNAAVSPYYQYRVLRLLD